MNRRIRRNSLIAFLSLAVIGCGAIAERRHTTITRSWPAVSITELDLQEVNGSVKIDAVPGSEIRMVANVRSRGVDPQPDKENQGFFRSEVDGDTLRIGRDRGRSHRIVFGFGREVTVDYEITVPPSVALRLTTVNGKIATRGIDGEMQATTVNGSLDLETTGSSELVARTVNGRVRARFISDFQGANLKTVNGTVVAVLPRSASFACDLSQVNGDFDASFPLSIHSHPGRRRVSGEVNGGRFDLRIVTVNGDIHLEHGNGDATHGEWESAPAAPAVPPVPGTSAPAPVIPAAPAPPAPSST